jgi:hypothetical protein
MLGIGHFTGLDEWAHYWSGEEQRLHTPSSIYPLTFLLSFILFSIFFSTGFKDMEALRRHLVDNLIGSCVWGLTFMYIRKMGNPEIRHTAWKNTQVRRAGGRGGEEFF